MLLEFVVNRFQASFLLNGVIIALAGSNNASTCLAHTLSICKRCHCDVSHWSGKHCCEAESWNIFSVPFKPDRSQRGDFNLQNKYHAAFTGLELKSDKINLCGKFVMR